MKTNAIERTLFGATRMITLIVVASSLIGTLLMFYLGAHNTFQAVAVQFEPAVQDVEGVPTAEATVISLMVALDRFLIGLVLLFFAYGVYGLFVRPQHSSSDLGLPEWLHVEHISQLKQTLAEVIIVALFVLFIRLALQTYQDRSTEISALEIAKFMALPLAILLLSGALRLAALHPKPKSLEELRRSPDEDEGNR